MSSLEYMKGQREISTAKLRYNTILDRMEEIKDADKKTEKD